MESERADCSTTRDLGAGHGWMNALKKNLGILFLGLLFGIASIFLHECGHYLAARALGFKPHLHYALTTFSPAETPSAGTNVLIAAAGPGVNALLLLAGFIWLWQLRHDRLREPATLLDWVATILILSGSRWLFGLPRATGNPGSYDEAVLSVAAGLPAWVLPYALAAIALILLALAIHWHPAGGRLVPFCAAAFGCSLGALLWLKVLGPCVLP